MLLHRNKCYRRKLKTEVNIICVEFRSFLMFSKQNTDQHKTEYFSRKYLLNLVHIKRITLFHPWTSPIAFFTRYEFCSCNDVLKPLIYLFSLMRILYYVYMCSIFIGGIVYWILAQWGLSPLCDIRTNSFTTYINKNYESVWYQLCCQWRHRMLS